MSLRDRFADYLEAYSRKDLEAVAGMFADDIALRDWKISVSGKETAVAETEKNFNSADSIRIEILNTYESDDAVAGELRITVDESEVLHVVDVVTYDADGRICSIRAYLGRED